VAEVSGASWPELLSAVDDVPPATIILSVKPEEGGRLVVRGVSHDNGEIVSIRVNEKPAAIMSRGAGVCDWQASVEADADGPIIAFAEDAAGNVEQTQHRIETAQEAD
jgi:hypothetical protein